MKKVYSLSVLFVLVSVLAINFAFAQSIVPGSADATGNAKNDFSVTDEIYVKSEAICGVNKTVNLYILGDKGSWAVGDVLVDVRGAPQNITTDAQANLPLTKIWEKPKAGKYDIILDCNNDGKYDYPIEPIDAFPFAETGFKVTSPAGTGKASLGKNNPTDSSWQYDSEAKNTLNEMVQLNLLANGEDILLQNITLKSAGVGNNTVEKIEVYLDKNGNGKKDTEDAKIGESSFAEIVTFGLEYSLPENVSTNFLVAYIMKPEAKGNLSLSVLSIYGKGKNSLEMIKFSGLPLDSITKTVLTAKLCRGVLTLVFPASVKAADDARANMNNLTGCQGKTIKLQPNPCTSTSKVETCSCVSGASGCNCNFTAPDKNKTYWACMDKNNDTDTLDLGESAYTSLVVGGAEEKAEEQPQATATAIATPSPSETINLGGETVSAKLSTNTFFLVMEITLVLILLMLFFILLSLRKGKKANNK